MFKLVRMLSENSRVQNLPVSSGEVLIITGSSTVFRDLGTPSSPGTTSVYLRASWGLTDMSSWA